MCIFLVYVLSGIPSTSYFALFFSTDLRRNVYRGNKGIFYSILLSSPPLLLNHISENVNSDRLSWQTITLKIWSWIYSTHVNAYFWEFASNHHWHIIQSCEEFALHFVWTQHESAQTWSKGCKCTDIEPVLCQICIKFDMLFLQV